MRLLSFSKDGHYLKLILGQFKNNRFTIEAAERSAIESDEQIKDHPIVRKAFSHGVSAVTTSIPSDKLYVKHLTYPFASRHKIIKTLQFQTDASGVLTADCHQCFQIYLHKDGKSDVTLSTVRKAYIPQVCAPFVGEEREIEWVGADFQALLRYTKYQYPKSNPDTIIYVGENYSLVLIMNNSVLVKRFYIETGSTDVASMIMGDQVKKTIKDRLEGLRVHLLRVLDSVYTNQPSDQTIKILRLGFAAQLFDQNAFGNYQLIGTEMGFSKEDLYSREIGQAIDTAKSDEHTVQLLIDEHWPKTLRRWCEKRLLVAAVVLATAIVLAGVALSSIEKQAVINTKIACQSWLTAAGHSQAGDQLAGSNIRDLAVSMDEVLDLLENREKAINFTQAPLLVSKLLEVLDKGVGGEKHSIGRVTLDWTKVPSFDSPNEAYEGIATVELLQQDKRESLLSALKKYMPAVQQIEEEIHEEAIEFRITLST